MEAFISTIVWAAIFQGIFLVGLYLFSKKHQSLANRLLGLFLFAIIFEGTLNFIPYDHVMGYPWAYFIFPEVKLFYPALFLHYVLEKIGRSSRYRTYLMIQYGLGFLVIGISVVNFFLMVTTGELLEHFAGESAVSSLFMAQQYLAFLLVIANMILAFFEMKRYKRIVQLEYSDQTMFQVSWLWRFIFSLIPVVVLWGANLIWIVWGGKNNADFELATWALVIVFIYFVSYQAFRHKNLFDGVQDGPETAAGDDLHKDGKLDQAIGSEEVEVLIRKIKGHMATQQPFLDASLSIYQLAKQVNIPVRDLSLIINHGLDKHFFDFVNEYRIEKAMKILEDPHKKDMTILEILYEVGFNSKSSFNTVFKKITGQTPTEYRSRFLA